jgi:hypothetical protein
MDAARTWTGATSTEWNLATNWNPNNIPTSGDDVTIPANVASGRYPIVSTAAANAKTVTLATGAGPQPSLTVSANTLTVEGNFAISAGTVTHSGGTIAVTAGAVTIGGTLDESGGTFLSSVNMTVSAGGNLNVSSTGVIHMATATGTAPTDNLIVDGTVTQSGGSVGVHDLTVNSGDTYNQSNGTFKITHDFKNAGTYNGTGGTVDFHRQWRWQRIQLAWNQQVLQRHCRIRGDDCPRQQRGGGNLGWRQLDGRRCCHADWHGHDSHLQRERVPNHRRHNEHNIQQPHRQQFCRYRTRRRHDRCRHADVDERHCHNWHEHADRWIPAARCRAQADTSPEISR